QRVQISKLLSGRTVAVVGARGFIGAAVVRALVDAGASVRGVTSLRQRGDEDNLKWVTGNARDQHFLESALGGCDIVINLASNSLPASSNTNLEEEIHAHVAWTIKTAEVAFGIGAKRFIFPSSGGTVYGVDCNRPIPEDTPTRPRNAYGVSKLAIEHYLRILHEIGRGEALS